MIYELVYNQKQQGTPFSFKVGASMSLPVSGSSSPQFFQPYANVMLGPSQVGLISLGEYIPAYLVSVGELTSTGVE